MPFSLDQSTALCRLLSDASRLRLLLLLERHELTVAELTEVTGLAQSRVSTHLSRLRRAGLVGDRRVGASSYYCAQPVGSDDPAAQVWALLRERIDDVQAGLDFEHAEQVIRARHAGQSWAETVAGRMELHYSPGRTWEATARGLITLLDLGDVLDIASGDGVLAELLSGQARSITCIDVSAAVLDAAAKRLQAVDRVSLIRADMHALPLPGAAYDQVFLMHALAFAQAPQTVLGEAARVLRPGGCLIVTALNQHEHSVAAEAYDHVNLGVTPQALRAWLSDAGLEVQSCQISSRENRPPYFEVLTALARRPG